MSDTLSGGFLTKKEKVIIVCINVRHTKDSRIRTEVTGTLRPN